jgi:hypothetical protein
MASKLFSLFALASFAALASFDTVPAVHAVTVETAQCKTHGARGASHATNPTGKHVSQYTQKNAPKPKPHPAHTPAHRPAPKPAHHAPPKGCKRGLAWSNHEAHLIPKFKTEKVCWIYDWEESLQRGMRADGMHYIPMLWGARNEHAFATKVTAGYAHFAAGMNEPDISSQANLSPAEGARMWNRHFCGLKSQGYTLISPAPATGPRWLQEFRRHGVCDWDITAVHVYTTTVESFQHAVGAFRVLGKPIMVTEYSCNDYSGRNQQCDEQQIWQFLAGVNGWMDSQDDVLGYFFFAPMTNWELEQNQINGANALITADGHGLTALGKFYVGLN